MIQARVLPARFRKTALCSLAILILALWGGLAEAGEGVARLIEGLPLPSGLSQMLEERFGAEGNLESFSLRDSGWLASVAVVPLSGSDGETVVQGLKRASSLALTSLVRMKAEEKGFFPKTACSEAWIDALGRTRGMRSLAARIEEGMWSASLREGNMAIALVALPEDRLEVTCISFREMEREAGSLYGSSCLRLARERVRSGWMKGAILPFEEALREKGAGLSTDLILEYVRVLAGAGEKEKAIQTLNALIAARVNEMASLQWEVAGDLFYPLGQEEQAEACYNRAAGL